MVALGEGPHGNSQGHAFRLAVIRDPRFAQPDIQWKAPKLALIRGTRFGAKPFSWIYSPPPPPGWAGVMMEQSFDALLYLRPPNTMTRDTLPVTLCADRAYMTMRVGRLALSPSQIRQLSIDFFVKSCEATVAREKAKK